MSEMQQRLGTDRVETLEYLEGLAPELKGARVFVTGGTGFFGRWLLQTFAWLNEAYSLQAELVLLVRSGHGFHFPWPEFDRYPFFRIHTGDIRSFEFPQGDFTHVLHAAASGSPGLDGLDSYETFQTIVEGTKRVLEFSRSKASKTLYVSSGAVYGKQPPELPTLSEDYGGGPQLSDDRLAYNEAKRVGEFLCRYFFETHSVNVTIARCFGFMGPFVPLNRGFALGNFIQNCLDNRPLTISGDGTNFRSYLYAADLSRWLWTILIRGKSLRPYNVGSEESYSVLEIAKAVRGAFGKTELPIEVAKKPMPGAPLSRYAPSTERAQTELGLKQTVGFLEGIQRTVDFYRT